LNWRRAACECLCAAGLLLTLGACISTTASERLASGQVVADFDTYTLRRVGLTPFAGESLTIEQSTVIQSAFFTEISRTTSMEVVPLGRDDMEEIPTSEPYRRGRYKARTVIELARRYNLDALLVGTVTEVQAFPPQRLSVQLDMVASETGVVIWSGSVHLDARDERVRRSLMDYFSDRGVDGAEGWEVSLLSPSRFAQFAAYEIARLL